MTKRSIRAAALQSGYSSSRKYSTSKDVSFLSPKSPKRISNRTSPSKKLRDDGKQYYIPFENAILCMLPEVLITEIFECFVTPFGIDMNTCRNIQSTCVAFRNLFTSKLLWGRIPQVFPSGDLNLDMFKLIKLRSVGTEGKCFHVIRRSDGKELALKKARVYPKNEGVPYYMMRELSALKELSHPNICCVEAIHLNDFNLYLTFPYVEMTLQDILSPDGDSAGVFNHSSHPMPKSVANNFMSQIIEAVAYCHRRGILHRNLKPKHILVIPGNGRDLLEGAQVKLADFALVRVLGYPSRKFTTEVITLWYRPPEILMGEKFYSAAVDIWSMGCIYAEMLQGKPLFTGLCEIDQLFQIFYKMGTPSKDVWPSFSSLPHYQGQLFPDWNCFQLSGIVNNANEMEFDFLCSCLRYDPLNRLSAEECRKHNFLLQNSSSNLCLLGSSPIQTLGIRVSSEMLSMSPISSEATYMDCCSDRDIVQSSSHRCCTPVNTCEVDDFNVKKYCHDDLINLQKTTIPHYAFLRHLESKMTPLSQIFTLSDCEQVLRQSLIDWIVEIVILFEAHICLRTMYFAVALVDQFMGKKYIESNRNKASKDLFQSFLNMYKLIGATCFHIASKCEDVSYIGINELSSSLPEIQQAKDILLMEETVLNSLNFNLYLPTESLIEFKDKDQLKFMAKYLGEVTLLNWCFLSYKPSLIAAAIINYTLGYQADGTHCLNARLINWPYALEKISQYSKNEIMECRLELCREHKKMSNAPQHTMYFRYLQAPSHFVATWIPLPQ